jgi:hypothetical protein
MTFLQAHWGTILAGAVIVYGAIQRALPAKSADFSWGQFIIDVIKGIGQQLPSAAPKLTVQQQAAVKAVAPEPKS